MAYCGPRGLPRSHFLGGPDRWTSADRDAALTWQAQQDRTCPDCRTIPGDDDSREWFVAVCPGCEQMERAAAQLQDPTTRNMRGQKLYSRAIPS